MKRLFYIIIAMPLLLFSCGRKDSLVIDKEEMASLLADMHIAEAVVDLDPHTYGEDSMKIVLKQSIYEAHGVTAEQVDSSYSYYGRHIEEYMKVYDRTIQILTERQQELLSASNQQIISEGDSVNIWPYDSRFEISRRSASRIVTFAIPADSNWHHNDVFELRFKMVTAKNPLTARMVVEYADGSAAYNLVAGKTNGFDELCVRVDSTKNPVRISGYIIAKPRENEIVRLDSVALIKMRSDLSHKFFSLRTFKYGVDDTKKVVTDTITTDSTRVTATNPTNARQNTTPDNHITGHPNHKAEIGLSRKNSQPANTQRPGNVQRPPQKATTNSGNSAAQEGIRKRNELLRQQQNKK